MKKTVLSKVISVCLALAMLLGVMPISPDTFSIGAQAANGVSTTIINPFDSYAVSFEGETYVEFLPEMDGIYEFRIGSNGDISVNLLNDNFETISTSESEDGTMVIEYFYEAGKTYYFRITDISENNATVEVDMLVLYVSKIETDKSLTATILEIGGEYYSYIKFVPEKDGEYILKTMLEGKLQNAIGLFDENLNIYKQAYSESSGAVISSEFKAGETYYFICVVLSGDSELDSIDVLLSHKHTFRDGTCSFCGVAAEDVLTTVINPNESQTVSFQDEVYYKFAPEEDGDYLFGMLANYYAEVTLFDSNLEIISSDVVNDNGMVLIDYCYEEGKIYYFRITDLYETGMEIKVDFFLSHLKDINMNKSTTMPVFEANGQRGSIIKFVPEEDCDYTFSAIRVRKNIGVVLVDKDLNIIKQGDYSEPAVSTISHSFKADETYYFLVTVYDSNDSKSDSVNVFMSREHIFKDNICSVCGADSRDLIESDHFYEGNIKKVWEISKPGATRIAVTFSPRTYTDNGGDYITVSDGEGNLKGEYTGNQLAGKTIVVASDTVCIELDSQGLVPYYGFAVTGVEVFYDECVHAETIYVDVKEATCTKNGFTGTKVCADCNAIIEPGEIIKYSGHTQGEVAEVVEPINCATPGYTVYKCAACGEEYKKDWTYLSHTQGEMIRVVEPTCSENGYTVYKCAICGQEYGDNYIYTLDHTQGEIIEVVEPTCKEEGYTVYECVVCGRRYHDDFTERVDHTPGEPVEIYRFESPWCHIPSYYYLVTYCTVCGKQISREEIELPTKEHVEFKVCKEDIVEPTCTKDGSYNMVTYCENCIARYNIQKFIVPATGHSFGEWTVLIEPAVGVKGKRIRTCSKCGEIESEDIAAFDMMITVTDAVGNIVKKENVSGDLKEYSFDDIADGEYTVTVEKATYATRSYLVSATDGKVSLGFELYKNGDVTGDGKLNTIDVARANSHAKGVSSLTDYNFACADVNGDGKVNTIDVARINSHAKGVSLLW